MPVPDRSYLKEKVRKLPDVPGVYLMKDRLGSVLYVGKAKNLKRRVGSYFQPSRKFRLERPKVAAMLPLVHDFDVLEVRSESEALLLEGKLIKEWKPKYNTDFTDDKRFLHVRVDLHQQMPRFRLVRFRSDDRAHYFGPFAHSGPLRKTLQEMRQKFGILLGDGNPLRREDGTWQLYSDIRAEIYGHPNIMSGEEYRKRVENACEFLDGKSREWLVELKAEMQKQAGLKNYERAAELRDLIQALEKTTERTRKFTHASIADDGESALAELQQVTGMATLPRMIECFDISHISGSYCVASMVHFLNGKPYRKHYRRYKIKSFIGNDDFRAMCEVVSRRYLRLHNEGKPFPDMVLIDGGAGQVGADLRAFLKNDLEPPFLIGLAKKEEAIVFSDGRPQLVLPGHNRSRLLLQFIRDEAHRHANTYNLDLRRRRMRESILEDCPGLGERKRMALLKQFGSLERLRSASIEEIQQTDGIGPKLARSVHEFLKR